MFLTLLFFNYDWPLTRVATIFDFANMAAPGVVCLSTHKKLKRFDMDNIWAKFGACAKI